VQAPELAMTEKFSVIAKPPHLAAKQSLFED
jgi:hypothetical protein